MIVSSLTLRAVRESDFSILLKWRSEPKNQQLLMWRSRASSATDITAWVDRRTQDPQGRFFVIDRAETPVGFVQLTQIDLVDQHAYLGLFIDESSRHQGIAASSLAIAERHAADLGVRKVLLEVLSDNHQALRFWAKSGYRVVGQLRNHHKYLDSFHDVVLLEKELMAAAADKETQMLPSIPNDISNIQAMETDPEINDLRRRLRSLMGRYKYAYNWTWFGRPIIQLPQDVMAIQMLVLAEKPDLIIETGIAHGGSLILSASLLELLGEGEVLGIDVDIRAHNRVEIEKHPLSRRISMIQGSSIDPDIIARVRDRARSAKRTMVLLDSNHTAAHVSAELDAYASLVTPGQHLVVFDTVVDDMPASDFPDRPWGPGNGPKMAVHAFLKNNPSFVVDKELESRLLFSVAPDGYLKRVS